MKRHAKLKVADPPAARPVQPSSCPPLFVAGREAPALAGQIPLNANPDQLRPGPHPQLIEDALLPWATGARRALPDRSLGRVSLTRPAPLWGKGVVC
jgi:hypothetical protein